MLHLGDPMHESGRAMAEDEQDDFDINEHLKIEVTKTDSGSDYLASDDKEPSPLLVVFHGQVAFGFGESLINKTNEKEWTLFATGKLTGRDGMYDLLTPPRPTPPVFRIYSHMSTRMLFLVLQPGKACSAPPSLANQLITSIEDFVNTVKEVVIFHSEPNAFYRCDAGRRGDVERSDNQPVYWMRTSAWIETENDDIPQRAISLPQPNLVAGVPAAMMVYCEKQEKKGLLLNTYPESEIVDSISISPFVDTVLTATTGCLTLMTPVVQARDLSRITVTSPLIQTNLYM